MTSKAELSTHSDYRESLEENESKNESDVEDVYQDVALIEYWDAAVADYKQYHSKDGSEAAVATAATAQPRPSPFKQPPKRTVATKTKNKRVASTPAPEGSAKKVRTNVKAAAPVEDYKEPIHKAPEQAEQAYTQQEQEYASYYEAQASYDQSQPVYGSYQQNYAEYSAPHHHHMSAAQPPPPPPFPMPPSANHASHNEDEALSNLIMAWYYSGYYTGYYQAQRRG